MIKQVINLSILLLALNLVSVRSGCKNNEIKDLLQQKCIQCSAECNSCFSINPSSCLTCS